MENSWRTQDFNQANAEVLEAISHPVRIKILRALKDKQMDFGELGKAVGIESAGQLSFHLTKLESLVKEAAGGIYTLTGDGKEALWGIQSMSNGE